MKIPHDNRDDRPRGGCDCLPRPTDAREPRAATPQPEPRPVDTYMLRYEDRWFGLEKRVTFEAGDLAAALALMEHEPIGSWAELTKDGKTVCRRGRTPSGDTDDWTVD